MAFYRFYRLDRSDHIAAGYSLTCRTDGEAMKAAGRLVERERAAVEVWEGTRRVARLDEQLWDRLHEDWTTPPRA